MQYTKKQSTIDPFVFYPVAIIAVLFVITVISIGEPAASFFNSFQTLMSKSFGWFVTIAINFFLITVIILAFGKYGNIRLGGENTKPEFSRTAWISMLFSAGMGIGLVYFAIAEPMYHYLNPISTSYNENDKVVYAMKTTFAHYGFHVWGIYCFVALSLAFFCFNRNKPLTLSSTVEGFIPKRYKFLTKVIDISASLATLFGLATSLGFGASQLSSGLEHLFGISSGISTQVIAIVAITTIATISIVTGLKNGVKILSQTNIILAAVIFFAVLFLGPTVKLLDFFIQSTGAYLQNIISVGTERGTFTDNSGFFKGWNMFYWAWWLSWSPFVGTFIARISKGRTIKEFVIYVIGAPSIATFIWMGVFGGLAFDLQLVQGVDVASVVKEDSSKALFVVLNGLPFSSLLSFLSILLVGTFFITSSDSGSLVVDYMATGGKLNTPVRQKIFWAATEGMIAIALLLGGGLIALQAASISTGFPLALFLVIVAFCLNKELGKYLKEIKPSKNN